MNKIILLFFAFSTICFGSAYADCTFAGKTYSEGASIPGYICQDGVWIPENQ